MKAVLLLLLSIASLRGATFLPNTIYWDANPASEGITNYVILVGTNSGFYTKAFSTETNTFWTYSQTNLFVGTNYVTVLAENGFGVASDPGNEIRLFAPVSPVSNVRIKMTLQASTDILGPWTDLAEIDYGYDSALPSRFFRGKLTPQ